MKDFQAMVEKVGFIWHFEEFEDEKYRAQLEEAKKKKAFMEDKHQPYFVTLVRPGQGGWND